MSKSVHCTHFRAPRATAALGLVVALLLASCASSGSSSSAPGTDARVTFVDLRTDIHLVIVNDAHLAARGVEGETPTERRAAFYSEVRKGDKPKVTSNEIMDKLLEYLDYRDFDTYAIDGPAPVRAEGVTQTIEIMSADRTRHLIGARGMDMDRGTAFRESVRGIQLTYNEILQLQSVDQGFKFEGVQVPATRRNN